MQSKLYADADVDIELTGGYHYMGKIRLNEDREIVERVKEGLKRTGGYCPCRLQRKPEYKCICEEFKAQMEDPDFEGYCHCMLYYKEK